MDVGMWARLLMWYRKHGRDLPWRETREPYRILLSEVMLQQTQVSRVLGYYGRWLDQFPDWHALARASSANVIRAWAGLGYNRRALNLRAIAQFIVRHGEPQTYEGWIALKGIGPYTAAAIALFAHGERIMPIDTNIRRVLGRVFLGRLFPQLKDDAFILRAVGDQWHKRRGYRDVPQALFDLANAHCLKQPHCGTCPLRTSCKSSSRFLSGTVRVPKRMTLKAKETIRVGKRFPDRIYRGRILQEVRGAKRGLPLNQVGPRVDNGYNESEDDDWMKAMIDRMVRDGLLRKTKTRLFLPRG